jgi:pilus assembly protein CpaF
VCRNPNAGKTTLLAALLALVPPDERIVIVEDSRELAPNHPHVVRIEGRPANTELAGAITLTDLVRQSLRMRPDRLVVGEVRGAEMSGWGRVRSPNGHHLWIRAAELRQAPG